MTTKLTLTVDSSVIEKAKSYAHTNRISLSKMVEFYLTSLAGRTKTEEFKLPPITQSLLGMAKTTGKHVSDKAALADALNRRYE